MEDILIKMNIDDALIEKPYPFSVDDGTKERRFFLYPVTLGKLHVLNRHMENLGINFENVKLSPHAEALRIAKEKKVELAKVITYHTMKKKRDIFDIDLVDETTHFIKENSSEEDLAALLVFILSRDNVEQYKDFLGITKEKNRLRSVLKAKAKVNGKKTDYEFGGKTVYGTLIDQACERYGWTYDYVIWGISLVNLQLLLDDRVNNVYLSEDELKKIPSSLLSGDTEVIRADNKENMEKILSMDWR